MDAEASTGAGVAAGVLGGGGLLLWFAKRMVERLIQQLDQLAEKVARVSETSASLVEHDRATDERLSRVETDIARQGERLEAVRSRAEGLSTDYGPRLKALEERTRA